MEAAIPKKRSKPFPANNATKKMLEAANYEIDVVERRLPHCFITKDFLGFADLLGVHSDHKGVLAIQATATMSNRLKRIRKILAEPRARKWVECGNRIQVYTWRKIKGRYEPQIDTIDIDHFCGDASFE